MRGPEKQNKKIVMKAKSGQRKIKLNKHKKQYTMKAQERYVYLCSFYPHDQYLCRKKKLFFYKKHFFSSTYTYWNNESFKNINNKKISLSDSLDDN